VPRRRSTAAIPKGYTIRPATVRERVRNRLVMETLLPFDARMIVWTPGSGSWRHCMVCQTPIMPNEIEVNAVGVPQCHIECVPIWEEESLWFRALCAIRSAEGEV
jgi:hypothetical protein